MKKTFINKYQLLRPAKKTQQKSDMALQGQNQDKINKVK